jgi:hypothetical protein
MGGPPLLGRHFAELQSAPTAAIAVAAAGSVAGQIMALVQAAPVWLFVVAALAPWIPFLVLELIWTYRHYRWLALFCLLLITQSGYLLEQVARAMQVHVLHEPGTGIFGAAIDPEQLHLTWAIWALAGLSLLIVRFPRNLFLWLAALIAILDLFTRNLSATAGIATSDLQLVGSVLGIAALNLAFASQLGRTYDAWLARAFPQLPERMLIDATTQLEEVRLRAGQWIEPAEERLYIVTAGSGTLTREGPGGHEILLRVLAPGEVVNKRGTLKADTALELLALPSSAL